MNRPETIAPGSFLRLVSTPPSWPWRQAKAAELQARLGAPVADNKLLYAIRRTSPWRPRASARFAILYAHKDQIKDAYSTELAIEGRTLRFTLQTGAERRRDRIVAAAALGLGIALVLALGVSATAALERRATSAAALADLDVQSLSALKRAQIAAHAREDSQRLLRLGARDHDATRVLEDLLWVSTHRRAESTVTAFHWESGLSAVEVEGDGDPFVAPDRTTERADKPIRPGAWLWGVGAKRQPSDRTGSNLAQPYTGAVQP